MNSQLSLYKSVLSKETVPSKQLQKALNDGKNISIIGTLGLHRTFTYLKALLESLPENPSKSPDITSLENLYIARQSNNLTPSKYLLISPNTSMSTFLYSFSRTVSPSHIFSRIDLKFSNSIQKALTTESDIPEARFLCPPSDIIFSTPSNFAVLKTIQPRYLVLDSISE
jgi:hypothetical protein